MRNNPLASVFTVSFFYSIHMALVSYINSSMLSEYVSANMVSVLFATGSALSIILMLYAPRLMQRFATIRVSLSVFILSAILLWILGTTLIQPLLLIAFVLYLALNACVFYTLDIFIEHYSTDNDTGKIRGLALTINNLGWISMPVIAGIISTRYGFSSIYLLAALVTCIAATILTISQRNFKEALVVNTPNLTLAFSLVKNNSALRRIISINFLLQFFYSWMILYVPLYLVQTLGFSWTSIGGIFSLMLIPFVLFQYPAGRIADKWFGEKEMIIMGLLIMAGTVATLALVKAPTIVVVAIILFGTRVGASIVEVLADSYFFKQVTAEDKGVISFYRTMQPFAYIVGPIAGAFLLFVMPYTGLFLLLGVILVVGALYTRRLIDTR
ncbi:MFS transporter [Patescibacteria group bacterium]|nr:MFS transporter [Patescibacteria group bacterium]